MLTVHHLGISQSDRVIWLCEELEIPYQLEIYQRLPDSRRAPPQYKGLHRAGTAPVITDGEVVLAESGAILEYIDAMYGEERLSVKKTEPGFADYLHWLHFSGSSLMATGAVLMMVREGDLKRTVSLVDTMQIREDDQYDWVESWLTGHRFFAANRFTVADIMMFFPLATMRMNTARSLDPFPSIKAYLRRIIARPAYLRALKRGDPDLEPLVV